MYNFSKQPVKTLKWIPLYLIHILYTIHILYYFYLIQNNFYNIYKFFKLIEYLCRYSHIHYSCTYLVLIAIPTHGNIQY